MNETILTKSIGEHPFFDHFKPEHRASLEECASTAEFKAGTYLFREREKADKQYLILEGRVAMELQAPGQDPWLIMTVGDGGTVGFAWAYPPYNYYFSCRVLKDTRMIVLDAECIWAKCKEDYEFGYQVMLLCTHTMADRLMATRLQLLNLLLKGY